MTRPFRSLRLIALLLLLLAGLPAHVLAWGPHPEITQAAIDTLASDDALMRRLGPQTARLRDYCWMADWRRQLRRESTGWFYTDDYLLFHQTTTHRDHLCPEVKQTYGPYFRRALQALRTETPLHAARWIGSLIHFTEDTGSPPHAAEIRGEMHSKMENWVDAKAIHLSGYDPHSLGETDDTAVAGFLQRMDGLIAFSKERAERAKPFVVTGDRAAVEPIVLESAREASRVVADLLFTLGRLADQPIPAGAGLRGRITTATGPTLEKIAAKIMLAGTDFSTLTDAEGHYEFRNLPPGSYEVIALRSGAQTTSVNAVLTAHQVTTGDVTLPADSTPGNMLRNSSLAKVWLGPDLTDMWYRVKSRAEGQFWESEMIPLEKGKTYQLRTEWQDMATGYVLVRLRKTADLSQLPQDLPLVWPGTARADVPAEGEFAQVLIFTETSPSNALKSIALAPFP